MTNKYHRIINSYGIPTYQDLLKYFLEGLAVSICAYFISFRSRKDLMCVFYIGLSAAVIFYILDMFAPLITGGARQGAGFGIGYGLVGGAKNAKNEKHEEHEEHEEHEKDTEEETKSEESDDETKSEESEEGYTDNETEDSKENFESEVEPFAGYPVNHLFDVENHNNALY